MNDPVLETLLLAIEDGFVASTPQTKMQFLRARFGHGLKILSRENTLCAQGFKPEFALLQSAGFNVATAIEDCDFALSLVLPPRQREEGRALLAQAVNTTADGGTILACVSNLEGAKTVEGDLKALLGEVQALSKNKCRAFWGRVKKSQIDQERLRAWLNLDAPRPCDTGYISRPGIFSWDRLDKGSKLLIAHLPPLSGLGADLGCGYGYLMAEALKANPTIVRLDGFEAEARAVEVALENMRPYGERAKLIWADVTTDPLGIYDFIISNPPFHTDRADRHELGQAFIQSAAKALKKGGAFYMVANRHLPYEATLKTEFKITTCLFEGEGYKIYRAIKG